MKRILLLIVLLVLRINVSFAQPTEEKLEKTIKQFFDALSAFDYSSLREHATTDFLLLEDGQLWNVDTLINKVNPRRNSNIKRVNSFDVIKAEANGNVGWISYHNTAVFTREEKQQTVRWLESAVLINENGKWRIKLLHSTRLK